jgi:hypothetical protein
MRRLALLVEVIKEGQKHPQPVIPRHVCFFARDILYAPTIVRKPSSFARVRQTSPPSTCRRICSNHAHDSPMMH